MTDAFILHEYLKISGIKVRSSYLEQLISTHPDFPSLFAYADTLDLLGIGYAAVQTAKDELEDLQFPLIAVTPEHPNIFELIYSPAQLAQDAGITDRWNGMVIMVETGGKATAPDYLRGLTKRKKRDRSQRCYLSGLALLLVVVALYSGGYNAIFNILNAIGLLLTSAIILHQLGHHNHVLNWFCKREAALNCNLVLNSRISFPMQLKVPDLAMVYFLTLLLYTAFAQRNVAFQLLLIPVATAALFALFLIWQQWKVLRTWCKICSAIICIIAMQLVLILAGLYAGLSYNGLSLAALLQLLVAFAISLTWIYFKPYLTHLKDAEVQGSKLLQWKRDPSMFSFLLKKEPEIESHAENSIAFGNPSSRVKIVLFVKPFCSDCAAIYLDIYELFQSLPDLSITTNFVVSSKKPADSRNKVIANLLQAVSGSDHPEEILLNWFLNMDLKKLERENGTEEKVSSPILGLLAITRLHVMETPVVAINGHKLPPQYTCQDLTLIIPHLL